MRKTNFIESFVKFLELSSLSHERLVHKERRLHLLKSTISQEIQSVVDHRLIQIHSVSSEEESTMTSDLGTCEVVEIVSTLND